jgi:hypothetical protein
VTEEPVIELAEPAPPGPPPPGPPVPPAAPAPPPPDAPYAGASCGTLAPPGLPCGGLTGGIFPDAATGLRAVPPPEPPEPPCDVPPIPNPPPAYANPVFK